MADALQAQRGSPRALRVALFSGNYNCVTDGANQALNRLVRYLIDVEHAVVRVYSPVAPQPAFPPAGNLIPVRSVGIPTRPEYRVALGMPDPVRADVREFAPDVVHLSAPDILGVQAQAFARRLGIPIVTSLHTRFETYLDYYKLGFLRRWTTSYLRRFYDRSDLVLAPNQPIADELADDGLRGRVRVWSRGVDTDIFSPRHRSEALRQSLGFGERETVLLFFGRLVREKGLESFADAVESLRARGYRVRPLVVGEGPARALFAERLGDACFVGHRAGAELGRTIASADILYNPSLTEAFGNVTLEAMAAGLAVVCPNVPSARALVTDGVDGVLLRPGDPAAGAISALLDEPERRLALGRAAAKRSRYFTWDAANAAVAEAYRDLIAMGESGCGLPAVHEPLRRAA